MKSSLLSLDRSHPRSDFQTFPRKEQSARGALAKHRRTKLYLDTLAPAATDVGMDLDFCLKVAWLLGRATLKKGGNKDMQGSSPPECGGLPSLACEP